jgi:hypothetical protein
MGGTGNIAGGGNALFRWIVLRVVIRITLALGHLPP